MTDAVDVQCEQLRQAVRDRIGKPAETFSNTVDVMVDEACRFWPEKEFVRIALAVEANESHGMDVLDAIGVLVAKCRENLEARWGMKPSHCQAISLLMESVVVELANVWFSNAEARIAMREVIERLRNPLPKRGQKRVDKSGEGGGNPPA